MKKALKIVLLIAFLIGALFILTACGNQDNKTKETTSESNNSTTSKTEGIDIESLSDEEKIEHYMHALLKDIYGEYGEKLEAAKIYVDKMYNATEVAKDGTLKSLNLGEKDIAFEVSLQLQPVEGADIFQFTVPDGVYDEDTGWVNEIHRLGVLRYNTTDKSYSITNYGTGW